MGLCLLAIGTIRRGAVFIGNRHRQAWGCVCWQCATSGVGLCVLAIGTVRRGAVLIGRAQRQAWGLFAVSTVRRGAVLIDSTHRQLSASSEASSSVSSLFKISQKRCSLSEGIRKQSGEMSV